MQPTYFIVLPSEQVRIRFSDCQFRQPAGALMSKKDTDEEVDYMHPDGTKKKPPKVEEEKKNEEKAEESTELVEELQEEQS